MATNEVRFINRVGYTLIMFLQFFGSASAKYQKLRAASLRQRMRTVDAVNSSV